MSEYRRISVWFGVMAVLLAIGCNLADEDGPKGVQDNEGERGRFSTGYSYFLGATLLATTQELETQVAAVEIKNANGLGLVDQYYFERGKRTDAVETICSRQSGECKINTAPYRSFQNWVDHIVVVGPHVPKNLTNQPPLDANSSAQVALCNKRNPGLSCGHVYLASLIKAESKRIGDLQPALQHDAFKASRDYLDAMDTLNGVPIRVSLPPKYRHSSFEVLDALMKDPGIKAVIACPEEKPGVTCSFVVKVTVGLTAAMGNNSTFSHRATARAYVIREQPNPSNPSKTLTDFLWLNQAQTVLKYLKIAVTEVKAYPQTNLATSGGTWERFYATTAVNIPNGYSGSTVYGASYLGQDPTFSAVTIVQEFTPKIGDVTQSDVYVTAQGIGIKGLNTTAAVVGGQQVWYLRAKDKQI